MAEVTKLPIILLVGLFVFYIVTHMLIGKWKTNVSKETPLDEKRLKTATTLFKWYPAIYVLFTILVLYNA